MSSSSGAAGAPNTDADEAYARALQASEDEKSAALAAAQPEIVYDDSYDNLSKEALLRELRIRDQELVQAVTEVQLLRANISKAEELG